MVNIKFWELPGYYFNIRPTETRDTGNASNPDYDQQVGEYQNLLLKMINDYRIEWQAP